MAAGIHRLETEWRLVVLMDMLPVVRIEGVYRLCRGGGCAEVIATSKGIVCESAECRMLLEEQLAGGRRRVLATVSPATWRPQIDLPPVPEFKELLEGAGPLPACWYEWSPSRRVANIENVLEGAMRVRGPDWTMYFIDGAIVVMVGYRALVLCLRPECNARRCREVMTPLAPHPIMQVLVEAIEGLAHLVQYGPEVLLGVLATVMK